MKRLVFQLIGPFQISTPYLRLNAFITFIYLLYPAHVFDVQPDQIVIVKEHEMDTLYNSHNITCCNFMRNQIDLG